MYLLVLSQHFNLATIQFTVLVGAIAAPQSCNNSIYLLALSQHLNFFLIEERPGLTYILVLLQHFAMQLRHWSVVVAPGPHKTCGHDFIICIFGLK